MPQHKKHTTYALASPSPLIFGRYGAVIDRDSSMPQFTSPNHGWSTTSPCPRIMFPNRREGSVSMSLSMRWRALPEITEVSGHTINAGPRAIFS